MVWWIETLKYIFYFLCLVVFVAGCYYILSIITNTSAKRRYKKENDIGRKRQDFAGSISLPGAVPGIRENSPAEQRSVLENSTPMAAGTNEPDIPEHREEPGVYSNENRRRYKPLDYYAFKKEFLD